MSDPKAIRITLRAARVNKGLRLVDAAKEFGINKDTLSSYEKDSTKIPRNIFSEIENIYGVHVDNIFFGVESDFFRKINNLHQIKYQAAK